MQKKLISIVTAVLNDRDALLKTIESIREQECGQYELIVVDGCSEDGTRQVIEQCADVIDISISEKDNGIYDAMNKGIQLSTSQYITFLNAGDYYTTPNALLQIVDAIQSNKPDMIYSDAALSTGKIFFARELTKKNLIRYGSSTVVHQTLFVSKKIVNQFDITYEIKSDFDWYFGLLAKKRHVSFYHIQKPLVAYDMSGVSSRHFVKGLKEHMLIIKKRVGFKGLIAAFPVVGYSLFLQCYRKKKRAASN